MKARGDGLAYPLGKAGDGRSWSHGGSVEGPPLPPLLLLRCPECPEGGVPLETDRRLRDWNCLRGRRSHRRPKPSGLRTCCTCCILSMVPSTGTGTHSPKWRFVQYRTSRSTCLTLHAWSMLNRMPGDSPHWTTVGRGPLTDIVDASLGHASLSMFMKILLNMILLNPIRETVKCPRGLPT